MTKQTVHNEIEDSDWWDKFSTGCSVQDAIAWLVKYPSEAIMDGGIGYGEYVSACIQHMRLETDEEEYAREHTAEIAEAKKKADKEIQQKARAVYEESLLQSKVAMDVAVWAYLEKHKDNPNKADLSNLYRAKIQLELDGHMGNSTALRGILECMERLENV